MKIRSEISEIRKASSKIIEEVKDHVLNEEIIFDIRLSAEEALRNAIQHGNKDRIDLPVNISYSVDDKILEIVIEDKGEGFDYKSVPDPTTGENILKTSGRGVFLIHKLMDEVHYNDKGNRIRMVKYLRRE